MSVADVVTFVSVGIIGGAIIQYPLGYLSDRWDRRYVLLMTTCSALLAALALVVRRRGPTPFANFVLVFIFGSFAMPLFSLSAAHANDRAGQGRVRAGQCRADAVLFLRRDRRPVRGLDSRCNSSGPSALFIFIAVVYAIFIVIILYRMQVRSGVPASQARPLHRTSAHIDDFRPPGPAGRATPTGPTEADNQVQRLDERARG